MSKTAYELRLQSTAAGTGYFACLPVAPTSWEDALAYLRQKPLDSFMHKYALDQVSAFEPPKIRALLAQADGCDPVLEALLHEAILLRPALAVCRSDLDPGRTSVLAGHTPQIFLSFQPGPDRDRHHQWIRIFADNILSHQPLPDPAKISLEPCYEDALLPSAQGVHVKNLPRPAPRDHAASPPPLPTATAAAALARLENLGLLADIEMRHVASLSPIALLRKWHLTTRVRNGQLDFSFSGIQTSYGRGLSLESARASYAMEIVERCSAFASFEPARVGGYTTAYPLVRARWSDLRTDHADALDPNRLGLETPYRNTPLHWLRGLTSGGRPLWVPAQSVFLFCNLDETQLFSGLGSTGLASGNTPAEARVSALLEVIERDGEATVPFSPQRCFRLETADDRLAALLAGYRDRGIHPVFQDLTSELGVPCFKCFVVSPDGQIIKGTGAHLDGKRAVISALTETPYPYPYGPPSRPPATGYPTRRLEALPDYATGHAEDDLALLEALLAANGFEPVYVDLTRRDIGFPVVKALVPGLELIADFDDFSRVSPRLFRNYLRAWGPSPS
ncbi:MAG TPA: YcaO-like family protein [Desulfobacterales bacterium]|nr:YcaO-like family protein [Desulfobacterales bacterium]